MSDDQVASAKGIEGSQAIKAEADAAKAVAEARKSQYEAELLALKAKFGDLSASSFKGEVALQTNAGKMEAELLASSAIRKAAKKIESALPTAKKSTPLYLFATQELPSFSALTNYRLQIALAGDTYREALEVSKSIDVGAAVPTALGVVPESATSREETTERKPPKIVPESVSAIATAGIALDAVTKLLSHFRSDFSVQGLEMTADDASLVAAIAGHLTAAPEKNYDVQVPGIFNPSSSEAGVTGILQDLGELSQTKIDASSSASSHEEAALTLERDYSQETREAEKKQLAQQVALHRRAAERLRAAVALHEALVTRLTAVDDKGQTPLRTVAQEITIMEGLKHGRVLLVRVNKVGGSYYVKKNLLSAIWKMPFFIAGGVVTTYMLFEGATGNVVTSGLVPLHGGFKSADEVEKAIEGGHVV